MPIPSAGIGWYWCQPPFDRFFFLHISYQVKEELGNEFSSFRKQKFKFVAATSVLVTANGCTKCISTDTNSSTLYIYSGPVLAVSIPGTCMVLSSATHFKSRCGKLLCPAIVLDEDGKFHLRNTSQEFLRTKKGNQSSFDKLVREPVSVHIIKCHIVYSTELRVEDNEE